MRLFTLTIALVSVIALTALAASAAFAAETLWTFLPGAEKTAFTGTSGKGVLETTGKSKIECTSSEIKAGEGEITKEKTLGFATVHFLGCKAFGFPANSLGDAKEIILVPVELHNCLISAGHAGISFKLLTGLHLEVPAVTLLLIIEGSFIGEITPIKVPGKIYKLIIEQEKPGKQKIKKCEGGVEQHLLTSIDGKAFEVSGEEAEKGEVLFTVVAQEAMV